MGWPFNKGKEEAPPDKKDEQGKSEVDALVDRMTQSFEQQFKPIREKVEALETKWGSIETAANAEVTRTTEDALTDEQRTAREKQALLGMSIQTNARLTESEVLGELAGKWGKFIPEIRKQLATVSLDRKALPNYSEVVRKVASLVIGEAAMSNGLSLNGSGEFFLEDAAGKSGQEGYDFLATDMNWTDPKSGKTFTAREQLAKLGITPDEFKKSIKKGAI